MIAVLLSAQCTDERVNKISPILFKVANNPFEMEKISKEKIYSIIKPCGLGPQKSKAISELSKILVKEFNDVAFANPNNLDSVNKYGIYTAEELANEEIKSIRE